MKICPRCQKTYPDDNLNFCLEDGSVLTPASGAVPPDTFMVNQPRPTAQPMSSPGQPPSGAQPAWNTPQQYSMQPPKKSSKAWVWVLLILGGLFLVCGGGFVGLVFWGASIAEQQQTANTANTLYSNTSTGTKGTNSTSTSTRTDVDRLDLSVWPPKFSVYGDTEYRDGELLIASKQKRFYYVLAGTKDQTTDDADTRVTLRNVDDAASLLGYGLVFHSNPTPLQQGYAFLLDTKKKKYRVVHHLPQKEVEDVPWTKSDAIRDGSAENTIEVRDLDDRIDLYINDKMVKSLKNTQGYSGGVVGLYSGDAVKIAFKDLEIRR